MAEKSSYHLPLKIALRAVLNVLLVWFLAQTFDDYLWVSGGIGACVVIGSLLTLMNLFVRPILNVLSIPVRLVATLVAIIIVNGLFLWITILITDLMDPTIVSLSVHGGIGGWFVLAIVLGVANWVQKLVIR